MKKDMNRLKALLHNSQHSKVVQQDFGEVTMSPSALQVVNGLELHKMTLLVDRALRSTQKFENLAPKDIEVIINEVTSLKQELGLLINVLRCLQCLKNGTGTPKELAFAARAYEAWCAAID